MKKFNFKNTPPFYPDWDVNIREFYSSEFKNIFVILNPFILLKGDYDRNNQKHNRWFDNQTMDYPTSEYINEFCREIKWQYIVEHSKLNTVAEINHALIHHGLKKQYQNEKLAESLSDYCNKENIFYPPDAEFTPYNISRITELLNDLKIDSIELTSEFGDYKTELKPKELKLLLTEYKYHSPTIMATDKSLIFVNHWDSFITILATNREVSEQKLNSLGLEIKNTNEFPTLNYRNKNYAQHRL